MSNIYNVPLQNRFVFSGKRIDTLEWIEGFAFQINDNSKPIIMIPNSNGETHEIDMKTLRFSFNYRDDNGKRSIAYMFKALLYGIMFFNSALFVLNRLVFGVDWKNYEGTTINVMFNEHNYSKAVIAKLADFEALTGIKVNYTSTPETNYFDKLNTALSSRSGDPDVFMTGAYQVWEYAPAGYMEPLEAYLANPALTSADYNEADFMPGVYDALKWDLKAGHKVGEGSQWALPMGWELNNISYNKRVFEEKGLTCPTTTDELLKTAQELQGFNGEGSYGLAIRGIRDWGTIHPGYMSLFATWGAEDFAIEDGKLVCKLDSEEAIAMTEYWVELAKTGSSDQWSTYTWVQCGVDLGAGKAAMMFDATSNAYFNNFEGASAESGNIAWGGVPLPEGKTEMKSNLWVWSLAMITTFFLPLASSLSLGEPTGFAIALLTSSTSLSL